MSPSESVFRVLLVCTGNTCRSPMAAGLLTRELESDSGRVQVRSAGTAAWEGQPATEPSIRVAGREGIALEDHRSSRLTPEMVRESDLILVMDSAHLAAVRTLGGDPDKVHLLSEYPPPGEPALPVSDPFGASIEAYEECWSRIKKHTLRIVHPIREALRTRSA